MPAAFAIRMTPVGVATVVRVAGQRPQHQRPCGARTAAPLEHPEAGTVIGILAGLFPAEESMSPARQS